MTATPAKKSLLIAGGSYADIPMILAAKALGFAVYTSGNRPDDLGHRHSDGRILADYSDPNQILDVARSLNVQAICPSCNDFSAISSAYAARALGLPGHDDVDTSVVVHHKDKYREFARAHGVPTPAAWTFESAEAVEAGAREFDFPVMVKPVDLTGGKGISKVADAADLAVAARRAFAVSRQKRVVVEQFVEGTRHGMTTFIRGARVVFAMSDDELYFVNPYLVSGAFAPGSVSAQDENDVRGQIERIAGLLKLVDGIVHVQFILGSSGPVIIEICRRPPGDLYVKLVSYVTGVDYPRWIVMSFAGMDPDAAPASLRVPVLRHCIMGERAGRVDHVHVEPCLKDKIIDQMLWADGARIENPLVDKVGIAFLKFDTPEELAVASRQMHRLIHPVVN